MSKIVLGQFSDLTNPTSSLAVLNTNMNTIQTAWDNNLSRSGVSPNQMLSNLDMDNNAIINLPPPVTPSSPLRLQDLNSFNNNGTISFQGVPTGGAQGQVLVKNSNTSYDTKWSRRMVSVMDFGATGNSSTDDGPAFNAASAYLSANFGGGTIFVPATAQNYKIASPIVLNNAVRILGEGQSSTSLVAASDITVVSTGGNSFCSIEKVTINGYGLPMIVGGPTTGTFPVNPTVIITSPGIENRLTDCRIQGGAPPISIRGSADCMFTNVFCAYSYTIGECYIQGAVNGLRIEGCSFDHVMPVAQLPTSLPGWSQATHYNVGDVVQNGSYLIQCVANTGVGAVSGSIAPVNNSYYGVNITDNQITWQLVSPSSFAAVFMDQGTAEVVITKTDLSGPFSAAVTLNGSPGPSYIHLSNNTMTALDSGVLCNAGSNILINNNHILCSTMANSSNVFLTGTFTGNIVIYGNYITTSNTNTFGVAANAGSGIIIANNVIHMASASTGVNIGLNVSGVAVSSNYIQGNNFGVVAQGSNNYFTIVNNIVNGQGVVDNNGAVNKTVSGNI